VSVLQESSHHISEANDSHPAEHEPDWFFAILDGAVGPTPVPPSAVVDALEFAKATLHRQLADVDRTSRHLQSLIRQAHAHGLGPDDIAVHTGLDKATVDRVLAGVPLVDVLFEQR